MLTGTSADPWLLLQGLLSVGVLIFGNFGLIGVGAVAARSRRPGWVSLVIAGVFGLLTATLSPVIGGLATVWAARQGVDQMLLTNATMGIAGAVGHGIWWGILLFGLVALVRGRDRLGSRGSNDGEEAL